jgi:hypothetical protein
VVQETLAQSGVAARELKEALGLTVPEGKIAPAAVFNPETGKVKSPSKLTSKIATAKNFLPGVVEKLEAAVARIEAKGQSPAKVQTLLNKLKSTDLWKYSSATYIPTDIKRQLFPASTSKGVPKLEKLPASLEPNRDTAQLTGGKAGMKRLEGLEGRASKGKTTVKTQDFNIAEHYGKKYTGPRQGVAQERIIQIPKRAQTVKAPDTFESRRMAKKYVEEETKAAMEGLQTTIDKLAAKGRLWKYEDAITEIAKGGNVPNLLDELSYSGKKLDMEGEYYLNKAELKKFEAKTRRRVQDEWDQLQQEGAEGRATARAQARVKELYESEKLPAATQDWLKEQTAPRLLGDITKWVDARIQLGDLKPTEKEGAIEFLRRKNQAKELTIGRGVSKTQRAAYMSKGKTKLPEDFLERATIQLEKDTNWDNSPNPWDEEVQGMDAPFTPDEMQELAKRSEAAGKVKESKAVWRRGRKIMNIGEWINITRPLVTAIDISNPFRQTWQLTTDQITQDILKMIRKDPTSRHQLREKLLEHAGELRK